MAISAAKFQIKEMPPWEWNSEKSSDTRAGRNEQDGVFITVKDISTVNDRVVGYFPGISMQFIGYYQWSRLRLLAISEMKAWAPGDGFAIKAKNDEKLEGQIWEPYRHWVYKLDSSRWVPPQSVTMSIGCIMLCLSKGEEDSMNEWQLGKLIRYFSMEAILLKRLFCWFDRRVLDCQLNLCFKMV
jgi:hypothetical protein